MLVPPRAVAALKNFRDIIAGGRAMLAGTYAQWLGDSVDESPSEPEDRTAPDAARTLPTPMNPSTSARISISPPPLADNSDRDSDSRTL